MSIPLEGKKQFCEGEYFFSETGNQGYISYNNVH